MLNYLKAFYRSYRERRYLRRLKELRISAVGFEDGYTFIQLESGLKFFGYPSDPVQEKQFQFVAPRRLKEQIPPEHFNIALDIVKRHLPHTSIEDARINSRFLNVKRGDVVIEGGAFTGYYAMQLSSMVGEEGLVIAIEAVPENFKLLKKNIESNGLTNVVIINKALSNQVGALNFFRNKKQAGSTIQGIVDQKEIIQVQGELIDNIVHRLNLAKVDFVRLQLNGGELNALKGMPDTLECRPQMLIAAPYEKDGIPYRKKITDYLDSVGILSKQVANNVCINIDRAFIPRQPTQRIAQTSGSKGYLPTDRSAVPAR